MQKSAAAAFTLVELLVVIVIIGILAGIALPVFQKAQEKARAISDQSNLRQLGIGIQTYKSDNNGELLGSDATGKWPQKLNPAYISTWKVFKSPFDKRPGTEVAATAPVSYGFNNQPPLGGGGALLGADSSKINYPSNLILMMAAVDVTQASLSYPAANHGNVDVFVTAPATDKRGTHLDRTRVNVLYADGHTEDFLWTKLKDTATDEGKKRWIYDYVAP